MIDALFYDDEADEGNIEVLELVDAAQSVLGIGVRLEVISSAIKAREWIQNRPKNRIPVVLILDIKNEDTSTRLANTPLPPDTYENSGLILAKLAYKKWPSVRIVFLTRLDYGGPASNEADKFYKVHQWVEKKGHGTVMQLKDKLRALFPSTSAVQIGRLTLDNPNLTIYYHHLPMMLGANVKKKSSGVADRVFLTTEIYNFLRTMLTSTCEKRERGEADWTVTFEELRRDDEEIEDATIHARKFEVCQRLRQAEALLQKVDIKGVKFDCAEIIVNTRGGYRMVEQ